ncbi:MAG: 4a-hydroxytetrahydrobiopterin dehydratase [Rickettsiales bacterium]|nr:4a-hydroxytetrahydrobiopterin dehydratase [Rickettsiales bacterium]
MIKDVTFNVSLDTKNCVPCKGGIPPLTEAEAKNFLSQTPLWELKENATKIYREFNFKNFVKALDFVNKVGAVAEAEAHHPDIQLGWGYVKIYIQTHKINGLHENDFILASKIDKLI